MLKTLFNISSTRFGEQITSDKDYGYCFICNGVAFAVSNQRARESLNDFGKQDYWVLTHLETGLAIGGAFLTRGLALQFINEIMSDKNPVITYQKFCEGISKFLSEKLNGQPLNQEIVHLLNKGIE